MFTTKLKSTITFGTTPDVATDFIKLPTIAIDEIVQRINQGVKVLRGKRFIRYTNTTLTVLQAIIKRIDRKHNQARISFNELLQMTGIVSRSTLADHLYILESDAQYVRIIRERAGATRNRVNVFKLIGKVADCVLNIRRSKTAQNASKTAEEGTMNGLESESNGMDDVINIPTSIKDFGIDLPMLQKLIQEHGLTRVEDCINWTKEQTWAKNPPALAVAKIRDASFNPAEHIKPASTQKQNWWTVNLEDENHNAKEYQRQLAQQAEQERLQAEKEASKPATVEDLAWRMAYNQLQLQLDRQTFDTWIKHAQLIAVDGNKYTVWHDNTTKRDICQHRLYRDIRARLATALGINANQVVIEFVTSEDLAVA
jgi:uncharacterized membrane protein